MFVYPHNPQFGTFHMRIRNQYIRGKEKTDKCTVNGSSLILGL